MSSYLVNRETIARVVYALTDLELFDRDEVRDICGTLQEDVLGQKLWEMNNDAVNALYNQNNTCPNYSHLKIAHCNTVQLFKSFCCYMYQCSEYPIVERQMFLKLDRMRDKLGSAVTREWSEYKEAEWC